MKKIGLDIRSLQPTMVELERILQWSATGVGFTTQRVVPTIQTRGKQARCGGWFAPERWSTREGQVCHEINFTAEVLKESAEAITALAVHEIVHLWCHTLGIKDVSKSGRHNKNFREYAEIAGLVCAKPTDTYGYGYTTAGEELAERIGKDCKPDVALFNLFRIPVEPSERKPKEQTYKFRCGCTEIRAKEGFAATCNNCRTPFTVVG